MAQDQLPPQQPLQDPQQIQIVRLRRTHKDELISSFLSKLSLREKLSMNKEIEEKNKEREAKTLRHKMDPVNHPDTGSETASLISIDPADIEDLKDQTMFARFLSVLPDSLIQRITCENRHEKEEKEKRKRDEVPRPISDEFKCRCMDGVMVIEPQTELSGYRTVIRTQLISLKSCIRLTTTQHCLCHSFRP